MAGKTTEGYKVSTRQVNFYSDEQLVRLLASIFKSASKGFAIMAQGAVSLWNIILKRIIDVFNTQELKFIISMCDCGYPSPSLLGKSLIHSIDMLFQVKSRGLRVDREQIINKLSSLKPEELWYLELWACRYHTQNDLSIEQYISQLVSNTLSKQEPIELK